MEMKTKFKKNKTIYESYLKVDKVKEYIIYNELDYNFKVKSLTENLFYDVILYRDNSCECISDFGTRSCIHKLLAMIHLCHLNYVEMHRDILMFLGNMRRFLITYPTKPKKSYWIAFLNPNWKSLQGYNKTTLFMMKALKFNRIML